MGKLGCCNFGLKRCVSENSLLKMKLFLLAAFLQVTFIRSEIIEVPNLALYQITPESDSQLHFLHKMRIMDSGMIFINGIGQIGETIDIIASPDIMEHHDKQMDDLRLEYDMKFRPVTIEMYNNSTAKSESVTPDLPTATSNTGFMEIEPISPPVFSGTFLNIFSSLHPDIEELSVGNSEMNSSMGNPFLCLSIEKHTRRSEHDGRKQWIFEKSEREGYYVLRNRKLTSGYVTWEDDEEPFLVIETRLEFQRQYKKGGKLRENALFKITRNTEYPEKGHVYEITALGMDGDDRNLLVDTRFEKQSGCYMLRRGEKPHNSDPNTANHLFKIHRPPGSIRLIAHLEDLKFPVTTEELFQKAVDNGTVKPVTSRIVNNHANHNLHMDVQDVHERLDKFHLKFDKPLTAFDAIWAPPGLSIGTPTTVLDTRHQNGIHAAIKLTTQKDKDGHPKDTVAKIKYLIMGSIQIPAKSSVEYAVVFGWLNRLELPFEASLRITGKADRMTRGKRLKVNPDQLVNFSWVKEVLSERHFHMHDFPSTPTDSEFSVEIPIKGTLVGWSIGIKGEIQITVNQLSTKNVTFECQHPD
ncbi:Zinc carboxypeptidase A 1 [Orchesella cincta]|uniref:Zinc carboxypeptidase A 1 n=1 Tax=Orchesella cincta TaxID=48709 RepID=A0A1D2NAS5_ORCCI|nr:Zinc carboxypeptidase A 1 [Orchesella cincta]